MNSSRRTVEEILSDAAAESRLSSADALTLLEEADLLDLGLAADAARDRHNDPAVASYNVDRNINYTNVCVYCCVRSNDFNMRSCWSMSDSKARVAIVRAL